MNKKYKKIFLVLLKKKRMMNTNLKFKNHCVKKIKN